MGFTYIQWRPSAGTDRYRYLTDLSGAFASRKSACASAFRYHLMFAAADVEILNPDLEIAGTWHERIKPG